MKVTIQCLDLQPSRSAFHLAMTVVVEEVISHNVLPISFEYKISTRRLMFGWNDGLHSNSCFAANITKIRGIKSSYNIGNGCREGGYNTKKPVTLYDQTGKRWCKIGSRQKRHQSENYAEKRSTNYNKSTINSHPYFGNKSKFSSLNGRQCKIPVMRATVECADLPLQGIQPIEEVSYNGY